MLGLFENQKEEEVSLADRIKAKPLAAPEAVHEDGPKARAPFAGSARLGVAT